MKQYETTLIDGLTPRSLPFASAFGTFYEAVERTD